MGHYRGRVSEIRLAAGRQPEVNIACPAGAIPNAGQYLLASDPADRDTALGTPIFLAEKSRQGFWSAPLFTAAWGPGTVLDLTGPLGHGFDLPRGIQRLGLLALGESVSRLMPLIHQALQAQGGVTLFTDLTLPMLPAAVEVYPLASLEHTLDWPDFLVLDVPWEGLTGLRAVLGAKDHADGKGLPCPAQVLVTMPMPCAGLAKCGACAVPARRGWKRVCEDGPVFDLNQVKW